jgi:dinuclear metal center YbgI/SA1388 family protein
MITVKSICDYLEGIAPRPLQESYDNSGLLTGSPSLQLTGVLISLDCTEEVVEEAIEKKANLIISHHPIIFSGLKSLTGKNYIERTIIKAIKNDIAIYAIHTNLDNVTHGVNYKLAEKIGLVNRRILKPKNNLQKLVTFIPANSTEDVLKSLHSAGAGNIGNYSECSFRVVGKGTFKANDKANPVIGEANRLEEVDENRIELIYPKHLSHTIIAELKAVHPYEEVAYYITDLENENQENGAGMIGELPDAMPAEDFLKHLKDTLSLSCIKHTAYKNEIKKVAICGGSGSFLLKYAIKQGADAFVTGDVKYHEFFDAKTSLMFCDIGHYESEVGTKELLYDLLTKKFTNFALYLSRIVTNPVKYFTE